MNLAATWETIESQDAAAQLDNQLASPAADNLTALRELVLRLLGEIQNINEVGAVRIESGFDFYEEVSRFEIDLIKRALMQTGGHQVRAAKLLNLKVTTLNSKIKHYNISLAGFGNVYQLIEPSPLREPSQQREQQSA